MASEKHNLTIAPDVIFNRVVSIMVQAHMVRPVECLAGKGQKKLGLLRRVGGRKEGNWNVVG